MNTLLTDYLAALGVPHTAPYSDRAYRAMPFQSCFGLKKLLKRYCIDSEGLILADKSEITKLPTPFLAIRRNLPAAACPACSGRSLRGSTAGPQPPDATD